MMALPLFKAGVKTAFLQTASSQHEVYVIHPRQCSDRRFMWLLDTAAYGLFNSKAKSHELSDETFKDLDPTQGSYMPHLFYSHYNHGNLMIITAKIVDNILVTRLPDQFSIFLSAFNVRFKFA